MKNIDFSKANLVIDDYLKALENVFPRPNRTWLEGSYVRNGLVSDIRSVPIWDRFAIWYVCLMQTKRLREVARAERTFYPNQRTVEAEARKLKKDRTGQVARQIRYLTEELTKHEPII